MSSAKSFVKKGPTVTSSSSVKTNNNGNVKNVNKATVASAANKNGVQKEELPKYPVACWRSIKNTLGDTIFSERSIVDRRDMLKAGRCPHLGKVTVVVKSNDDESDSDSSSSLDENGEKKEKFQETKEITAFDCGLPMPWPRVPGQGMCDKHQEEFLQRIAERDRIAAEREARWQENQKAWEEREARRQANQQRYQSQKEQREAYQQRRFENDPCYLHSREEEIFQEEIQQREFNGERQVRTVRYKVFEPNTYYTRREVKDAGFCTRLENDQFVCTAQLDPAFPRDGMCQEHMAIWREQLENGNTNNNNNSAVHEKKEEKKQEKQENPEENMIVVPSGPTYAKIAIKAEEEEQTKKALKKQAKAEAKAAAAAAAAEAASATGTVSDEKVAEKPKEEDEWQEVGKKNKKKEGQK